MIQTLNITKSYGNVQVLKGVSAEFHAGKIHGVIGKNGAGKTTMFESIAGLIDHEGDVSSSLDPLKDHLGFLPTNPFMFERITGREYLTLCALARKVDATNFDYRNLFDLPLDRYANGYSTGMRKKLALLGVLIQKNEVFLLDEPFNGVDISSNELIIDILKKLRDSGKCVIVSSHLLSSLTQFCDDILILEQGEKKGVFSKEKFHELDAIMRDQDHLDRLRNFQI